MGIVVFVQARDIICDNNILPISLYNLDNYYVQ